MAAWPKRWLAGAALLVLLCGPSNAAKAADSNPLRPPDMSSPRATLEGFVAIMDEAYSRTSELIGAYAASDRLYLSQDERQRLFAMRSNALRAVRALDTSGISPVLKEVVGAERAIELKEVLDRIGVPPAAAVPDREAMTRLAAKQWRMPDTEIDFVLMETGPRAGEYLLSANTIDRLPEFFKRVKDLPYLPGPGRQLSDTYRVMSGNQTATIFDMVWNSPVGLDRVVPTRWMIKLPDWARARVLGVTLWQWVGFVFALSVCALFLFAVGRLARRLGRRKADYLAPGCHSLLVPVAVMVIALAVVPMLSIILRIGGTPRTVAAFGQTIAFFLSAAWISVIGAGILGETIAASEHLAKRSLDSQLIRLTARFVGIVIAVALLMEAADELGFPSYSVLAGLGVGGLAIALAARDSLANFLGSVLIMFEKPFRVGHLIRVSGTDGVVEEVGFRSTRIRTLNNSVVSIPNNVVVNATVENLTLRMMFRQSFFVQLAYATPPEKMEAFSRGIEQIIIDHPLTGKDNFHVRLNQFGDSSLNIIVIFHLQCASYGEEIKERENILYQIMALAIDTGVEFAFPTRTLYVESLPTVARTGPAAMDVATAAIGSERG